MFSGSIGMKKFPHDVRRGLDDCDTPPQEQEGPYLAPSTRASSIVFPTFKLRSIVDQN